MLTGPLSIPTPDQDVDEGDSRFAIVRCGAPALCTTSVSVLAHAPDAAVIRTITSAGWSFSGTWWECPGPHSPIPVIGRARVGTRFGGSRLIDDYDRADLLDDELARMMRAGWRIERLAATSAVCSRARFWLPWWAHVLLFVPTLGTVAWWARHRRAVRTRMHVAVSHSGNFSWQLRPDRGCDQVDHM